VKIEGSSISLCIPAAFLPYPNKDEQQTAAKMVRANKPYIVPAEQKKWDTMFRQPKWLASALPKPLASACYEIILEEEYRGVTKERRVFLPLEGWTSRDFNEKMSWGVRDCWCCESTTTTRLRGWIRIQG
jgi:hypothetical protein